MNRQAGALEMVEREMVGVVTDAIVSGHARESWADAVANLAISKEGAKMVISETKKIMEECEDEVRANPQNRMVLSWALRLRKVLGFIDVPLDPPRFKSRIVGIEEVKA